MRWQYGVKRIIGELGGIGIGRGVLVFLCACSFLFGFFAVEPYIQSVIERFVGIHSDTKADVSAPPSRNVQIGPSSLEVNEDQARKAQQERAARQRFEWELDRRQQQELAIAQQKQDLASKQRIEQAQARLQRDEERASRFQTNSLQPVLPGFFPWPPPAPSAAASLSPQFLTNRKLHTLGDTALYIEQIFKAAGYNEFRYYKAGIDGIAIVTPIHTIDEDGRTQNARIPVGGLSSVFSVDAISSWVKTIFADETVHLRLFVITVTQDAVIPDEKLKPTSEDRDRWMTLGAISLPNSYASRPLTKNDHITVLVYEFTNDKTNGCQFVTRSKVDAERHILGANLVRLGSEEK